MTGRKRKVLIALGLGFNLMFGGPRLMSSRSSNLNSESQVVYERVILDQQQESTSSDNSGKIIRTGNGTIFQLEELMPGNTNELEALEGKGQVLLTKSNTVTDAFLSQEEMEYLGLDDSGKTILAKGVDAFPVTPFYAGRRPSGDISRSYGQKPPRAPSGFYRMPSRPVKQQGFYGGATGLGGSGSSNPGGGDGGSSSNGGSSRSHDQNQCNNPEYYATSAKKKSVKIGTSVVTVSWDANGNPIFTLINENRQKVVFSYDQALAKYYHADVHGLPFPEGFDRDHALGLKPNERKAYIASTVPREKILEFLKANVRSLSSGSLQQVPGFIGSSKESGTIYFNRNTREIHFVNEGTNEWRTTIIQSEAQLRALANNDFHLFPNAK